MREKSFQNSVSKQKVSRAACSEQFNQTTGLAKASGTTCRLPVLVRGSVVDSQSHRRSCTTEELCELPACLPGTAWWHILFVHILDLDDQLVSIRWPLEDLFIFCPTGLCSLLSPLMSQELLLDWCQARLLVGLVYY